MLTSNARLEELFIRYTRDLCTEEEKRELFILSSLDQHQEQIKQLIHQYVEEGGPLLEMDGQRAQHIFDRIVEEKAPRIIPLRKWGWAAAILLLVSAGSYFWLQQRPSMHPPVVRQIKQKDIDPGKEGAVLTLADGTEMVLDSLGNGATLQQKGASAVLQNGQLTYKQASGEAVYNTLRTPRGRQFHLVLADGSEVWLNAASSIVFPTIFNEHSRKVTITGEAYFEVAQNSRQPFIVKVDDRAEVSVLGTHFNINAYEGEQTASTTLLEGAVKVAAGAREIVLKPGQQAQLRNANVMTLQDKVDVDKVMAWKNGYFNLDGVNIEELMRQLERWYDIEVVFEKQVPDIHLFGKLRKDKSLDALMQALQYYEIHFRREGRKLVILP